MVHKLYAERVQNFLYHSNAAAVDEKWRTIRDEHNSSKGSINETSSFFQQKAQILATSTLSGVSQARRGYVLLLFTQVSRDFSELSPFARQNISFVARITHEISHASLSSKGIGEEIWKCQNIFADAEELDKLLLRVDCFPRELTEDICLQLQRAAACPLKSCRTNHPFEGPIAMTKSKSKCTHRLVVISCNEKFLWGFENRSDNSELMDLKLNHEAADEIRVQPADDKLLNKIGSIEIENLEVPVSRAYYKLSQVWEDYLQKLGHGYFSVGCDLGASPGGWTQVLVHRAKLSKVVAIDAAQLASCVANLPQTIHVQKEMEKANLDEFTASNEVYSIVVCDASANANEIQAIILQVFQTTRKWAVPAVVVITMKFPFKTIGSIQRHISKVHDSAPQFLISMRDSMYPAATAPKIFVRYRLEHLMANSDSERTLIAIFENDT